MNLVFPLAVIVNTFAMTFLLIVLGISGKASLAADVGIVHGATLALFFAFSANARSLILSKSSRVQSSSVMLARLTLLLPLSVVGYLRMLWGLASLFMSSAMASAAFPVNCILPSMRHSSVEFAYLSQE